MASTRMVLIAVLACVLILSVHESFGAKSKCPSFCTYEYRPICGRKADGSTMEFGNQCALDIHKCENPGEIVSSQSGRCPTTAA